MPIRRTRLSWSRLALALAIRAVPDLGSFLGFLRRVDSVSSRPLAGRSRIWPDEDFTMKSLPRYLLIVFALAGDSTMTSERVMLAVSHPDQRASLIPTL